MTDAPRPPGKIILLNGASSSGKSSLARAVQARIEEPFWHISIDHLRDSGVLPTARIRAGEFRWATMRDAFFEGFEQSLLAYVRCGNNLIVEHIMESRAWLLRLAGLLVGQDAFFVGLHCDLVELERREIARGDRRSAMPGATSIRSTATASTIWSSIPPCRPRSMPRD